ncbi:MAG: bifunctional (p)ppGpp synthetase/guanosine-3',5'-bis(diphosphate) 3'-pyrophosphohydrolase, partial [Flavobacteriaceae bacterium]|nr:bifunctional (p)ppGpp synthetase/guanosine-3',5'-bis(diphosphate) 3'-pyrophosphohydrolase [Flavobacteriaceae bacterium]
MEIQSIYQHAIKFAAEKHAEINQTIPETNLPYVVHLSNVAMEILIASAETKHFDIGFAIQVALLHDTLEDTHATFEDLKEKFGIAVAHAV